MVVSVCPCVSIYTSKGCVGCTGVAKKKDWALAQPGKDEEVGSREREERHVGIGFI